MHWFFTSQLRSIQPSELFSQNITMFHVIFLATIALAAAGKDKMPEYEGMCLDPMETVKLCTMGTDMGMKMAEAAMTCKDYDVTTMRKKKPNKGKG